MISFKSELKCGPRMLTCVGQVKFLVGHQGLVDFGRIETCSVDASNRKTASPSEYLCRQGAQGGSQSRGTDGTRVVSAPLIYLVQLRFMAMGVGVVGQGYIVGGK